MIGGVCIGNEDIGHSDPADVGDIHNSVSFMVIMVLGS